MMTIKMIDLRNICYFKNKYVNFAFTNSVSMEFYGLFMC